ncbi:hypothetical protein [Ruminococcus sp. Marseille-P6503]|uniref:hypothetical protein n=1 Tax=Ruminococcus sp. Marseille-P6503 TaxID=2364796 RepID=UPI000F53D470|nr:hypothetical protein [Ruminococcus sp. Marseille-P6503]
MAEMTELEKIDQAENYFARYYEFEDAIRINKENSEYLKTYIHDNAYVEKNFNLKAKRLKSVGLCFAAGALVFGVMTGLLGLDMLFISAIGGASAFVLLAVFGVCLQHFRLSEAKKRQAEVNEGIGEQLELLDIRDGQLVRQKEDYYRELEKRVDFMSLDYMKNIGQIRSYLESGEASTCEEAVDCFEKNMLMQEMSSLTMHSDNISEPAVNTEAAKERLGDPLMLIKKNRKRKKKKESVKKEKSA